MDETGRAIQQGTIAGIVVGLGSGVLMFLLTNSFDLACAVGWLSYIITYFNLATLRTSR